MTDEQAKNIHKVYHACGKLLNTLEQADATFVLALLRSEQEDDDADRPNT